MSAYSWSVVAVDSAPTLPAAEAAPPRFGPREGVVLAERYRLVRQIGLGGMGSVWEGEHVTLGTPVAIKLIKGTAVDDEKARSRFLREARAAAALRSPNVVQIFDYGVHEDTPYIAMELLHGQSLEEKLRRGGALTLQETTDLIGDLLRAVAKAHDANVVHRDLKPDNVFIVDGDERKLAKVLDFGIAKGVETAKLDASTQEGTILGTPFYMSPEHLLDASMCDARSDLWSVAVITYECLLGHRPFSADTMPSLAVSLLATAPPVPSHRGDVPAGFDAWFETATMRDPTKRFQTAREMAAELELVLSGRGTVELTRTRVRAGERRGVGSFIFGGVSVAAAFVLGWLALGGQPEPAAAPPPPPHPPPKKVEVQVPAPAPEPEPEPEPEPKPEPEAAPAPPPTQADPKPKSKPKSRSKSKSKSKPKPYDSRKELEF